MESKIKIYEQGLKEYSKATIFQGNLLMILWVFLGTISCRIFCPLTGWIYLLFAIIMIGIILRKLLCTNCCYYNRWCCLGWGKLSTLFFKVGNIEKFKDSYGQKLAPFIYGLLTVIPLVFLLVSIFKEFVFFKLMILILLLLVSIYSGSINRKKTCSKCRMRLICKGCAVKQN